MVRAVQTMDNIMSADDVRYTGLGFGVRSRGTKHHELRVQESGHSRVTKADRGNSFVYVNR